MQQVFLKQQKTTALLMKTSTKHHPKADIDASIPPSNHRSKSLHQLSWSSPYMRTSVVQSLPVQTVQTRWGFTKDSKNPQNQLWDFCAQNHFYPLWYTVYLYHISGCFMHIQNLTSRGTSRKKQPQKQRNHHLRPCVSPKWFADSAVGKIKLLYKQNVHGTNM